VIAALWDVADVSTEQLMNKFYDELQKGGSPDAALRAAKLSLLRDSAFHNPYYWAPFQLYTQGRPANLSHAGSLRAMRNTHPRS
jgi:CHAT domain-containing protein